MGKITRIDTEFTNSSLPILIDYDTGSLEQEILGVASLRGFIDATDDKYINYDGGKVASIVDRTGNGLTFTQSNTALMPEIVKSVINDVQALYLDGSKYLESVGFFSDEKKQSVVAFLLPSGVGESSSIFLSDLNNLNKNFYLNNSQLRAFGGSVTLDESAANSKLINYICAFDTNKNKATLLNGENKSVGSMGGVIMASSNAYLGKWAQQTTNAYQGYVGHIMIFDEDISENKYILNLLNEYARRRYRTPFWNS